MYAHLCYVVQSSPFTLCIRLTLVAQSNAVQFIKLDMKVTYM